MADKRSVTVDAVVHRVHTRFTEYDQIVDRLHLPVSAVRACQQQAAGVYPVIALRQSVQLFRQFLHFAGRQKTRAPQVYAKHRLVIMDTGMPAAQQRTVPAYGDDLISQRIRLFFRDHPGAGNGRSGR